MDDTKDVTTVREVPRDPDCCDQRMKKMIVGVTTGNPRYQYACLKCGKQVQGAKLNLTTKEERKETSHV